MKLREGGALPYGVFSDNTRWQRKPRTYTGLNEALELTARTSRRALWVHQPVYVEVWCEKDAMASFFAELTYPYDVKKANA